MEAVSITVDVETDYGGRMPCQSQTCRGIEEGIPLMLELFNSSNIKATFFVSGMVVKQYRRIIREIHREGHEIASHGLGHNINYKGLAQKKLCAQLTYSKDILENTIGSAIAGFRAPQFRIHKHHFSILEESGYTYDSSLVSGYYPGRYNNLSAPANPFCVGDVLEIPVTTVPFIRVPMGLLWINAIGVSFFKKLTAFSEPKKMLTFYAHPFDIVGDKPHYCGGLLARSWYGFKAGRALQTFGTLLSFLADGRRQLIRLNDYRDSQGTGGLH